MMFCCTEGLVGAVTFIWESMAFLGSCHVVVWSMWLRQNKARVRTVMHSQQWPASTESLTMKGLACQQQPHSKPNKNLFGFSPGITVCQILKPLPWTPPLSQPTASTELEQRWGKDHHEYHNLNCCTITRCCTLEVNICFLLSLISYLPLLNVTSQTFKPSQLCLDSQAQSSTSAQWVHILGLVSVNELASMKTLVFPTFCA